MRNNVVINRPILLSDGKLVDLCNLQKDDISWKSLITGLATGTRYAGQAGDSATVLYHSLFVARLAEVAGEPPSMIIHCLLHDTAEAYLGDIPYALKAAIGEETTVYTLAERRALIAIYAFLEIPLPTLEDQEAVYYYDKQARDHELVLYFHTKVANNTAYVLSDDSVNEYLSDVPVPHTHRTLQSFRNMYDSNRPSYALPAPDLRTIEAWFDSVSIDI